MKATTFDDIRADFSLFMFTSKTSESIPRKSEGTTKNQSTTHGKSMFTFWALTRIAKTLLVTLSVEDSPNSSDNTRTIQTTIKSIYSLINLSSQLEHHSINLQKANWLAVTAYSALLTTTLTFKLMCCNCPALRNKSTKSWNLHISKTSAQLNNRR